MHRPIAATLIVIGGIAEVADSYCNTPSSDGGVPGGMLCSLTVYNGFLKQNGIPVDVGLALIMAGVIVFLIGEFT